MIRPSLDTEKLKNFPGIDLAFGWINAAHDYDCILQIERSLRQRELGEEELQLPENYSFYFARLRAAQTREAVGLCQRTQEIPELRGLIDQDNEAVECFRRLHTMETEGDANPDMKTIKLVRNTTFHYCMRQHKDWYQQAFDQLIAEGRTTLWLDPQVPNRFGPAVELLNRVFLNEALRMPDLSDVEACGVRMSQAAKMLVTVSNDFQVVARAIGRGLIAACQC